MSFENAWRGASEYCAAVGTDFVQTSPTGDMAEAFAAAHPGEHPRPNLVEEKRLAVIIKVMSGTGVGWRVSGEDMRALIVKIQTRCVDYHSICSEIGFAIVDHADLPAYGL